MTLQSHSYCIVMVNSIYTISISTSAYIFISTYHSTPVSYYIGYMCALLFRH